MPKRPFFVGNMSVFGVRSISGFVIYELAETCRGVGF